MDKTRFFATLHTARRLVTKDKVVRRLLLTVYMKGWTDCYWETLQEVKQ